MNGANSHMPVQELCREIFIAIANGWKFLAIVIKISSLDTGRVSGSTNVREWNIDLDLNLSLPCSP